MAVKRWQKHIFFVKKEKKRRGAKKKLFSPPRPCRSAKTTSTIFSWLEGDFWPFAIHGQTETEGKSAATESIFPLKSPSTEEGDTGNYSNVNLRRCRASTWVWTIPPATFLRRQSAGREETERRGRHPLGDRYIYCFVFWWKLPPGFESASKLFAASLVKECVAFPPNNRRKKILMTWRGFFFSNYFHFSLSLRRVKQMHFCCQAALSEGIIMTDVE